MSANLTILAAWLFASASLQAQNPSDLQPPLLVYTQPQLLHSTKPVYPKLAKAARIQGTVKLRVTIGVKGTVEQAKLINGHPLLVEAAIDAVRHWRYRPATSRGVPVVTVATIEINFTLSDRPDTAVTYV